MIRGLAVALCLLPSLALAEDLVFERTNHETASSETFPAFYDVTRVEEDGNLTHRRDPSWDAERVGGPPYGLIDRNVEIVALSPDEAWGLTDYKRWLPMEYLTRKPARIRSVRRDWEAPAEFPVRCEAWRKPFWAMTLNPNGTFVYADNMGDRLSGRLTYAPVDEGIYTYSYRGVSGEGSIEVSVVITRELCLNRGRGVNRLAFGFSADLAHETSSGAWQGTACCRLVP